MDYSRQSVGKLFRGPLLHTPQGVVLLISIAVYLSGAALFFFFDISPPFGWTAGKASGVFIAWPILLFALFIKQNMPEFVPSWPKAIWQSFYAVAPFVFISLGKLSSVD
jgi:hypothetical protein